MKGSTLEKNFVQCLHSKLGIQRNGCPESKKILRHRVCPDCVMQPVALHVGSRFAQQYYFPCICPSKQMKSYKEIYSPSDKTEKMLREIQNKNSSSYDILCSVTDEERTRQGLIIIKPLKKNTWDRNNQPSCDNIRITAVQSAFVKIAETREGAVEFHMQGPEMMKKKPYARLGVGVNMVSGKEWIPGVMYMISPVEQGSLPFVLNLALRYPPQFRGQIKVIMQKKIANAESIVLFDVDTRTVLSNVGINIGVGMDMDMNSSMNANIKSINVTDMNMNMVKMSNFRDIVSDCDSTFDRETMEENRASDGEMNFGNSISLTDSETQTSSLSVSSHDSDDQMMQEKTSHFVICAPFVKNSYCALCKVGDLIKNEPYLDFPCRDPRTVSFFEQIKQLNVAITANRLDNIFDVLSMHPRNCWSQLLFKANKFNGSCLHTIAQQGDLLLYQRLERVFSPSEMLENFCRIESPLDNQIPLQVALRSEKEDLVNYVFDNILKTAFQYLPFILRQSDWFGNTILFDSICYEKVKVLEKILYALELHPGLLSARDFKKTCAKGNSINKLLESFRTNVNGVCFMQYTIDWSETKRKTHCQCCNGPRVAKLLANIAERL